MKASFENRFIAIMLIVFSACAMVYLETQSYCTGNGVELSQLIESGELKSALLPDVFILENVLKSIINFKG
jgi:hypothetical protein